MNSRRFNLVIANTPPSETDFQFISASLERHDFGKKPIFQVFANFRDQRPEDMACVQLQLFGF
jgi:hypothetical protein